MPPKRKTNDGKFLFACVLFGFICFNLIEEYLVWLYFEHIQRQKFSLLTRQNGAIELRFVNFL